MNQQTADAGAAAVEAATDSAGAVARAVEQVAPNAVKLFEQQHPLVFYAMLSVLIGALVYASRKLLPGFWSKLEQDNPALSKAVQSLPAVLLGALASGSVVQPKVAFYGALAGVASIAGHHILKFVPLPYQGELGKVLDKKLKVPPVAMVLLVAVACTPVMACSPAALAAVAPIVTQVIQAITDAEQQLDAIDRAADRFFVVAPNVQVEAHYDMAMDKARRSLSVANRATAGAQSLTQRDIESAFYEFRSAYGELRALIESCGMVRKPGALSASAHPQIELAEPMALTLKAPQ